MLAPITPTVDYKTPYKLKHTWKEKEIRCGLKSYFRDDAQPIPCFPQMELITFTDQEYEVLKNPQWSRLETEQLLLLCKEFNLRFVIIHDRYSLWVDHMNQVAGLQESTAETEKLSQKPIEELKQRYFQINRLLLNTRNPNKDTHLKDQIASFSFDIVQEHSRTQNIVTLLNRTPDLVEKEEHLMMELKKWLSKDWDKKRDVVYKYVSHNAEAAQQYTERSTLLKRKKLRKNDDGQSVEIVPLPTTGVRLASQRMPVVKQSLQSKFQLLCEEFGVPLVVPMPTNTAMDTMEQVVSSLVSLLEVF
jgi:DNA methyltransferase 1-associated protein 1